MVESGFVAGLIIEGGIYFLLLFTPFAFGGVEMWAVGVFQIVTGFIVAAWAFGRLAAWRPARPDIPGAAATLWACIGLFLLLVLLQLVPMPPGWIAGLSPGAHDLYAHALPGYAEGRDFDAAAVPSWLLQRAGDAMAPAAGEEPRPGVLEPPPGASGFPTRASSWRTLSIYPFETRQRLTILLCYIGLFAVVASHFRSRQRIARLLAVAGFTAFAVSLFGILQKLTWNGRLYWVREGVYGNVFGPFVNRNSYAAFAGTVLPVLVCMALAGLRRVERGEPDALPRLLLWAFAAVTVSGGIFLCLSRGGILSAALSMVVVAALLVYYGRRGVEMAVLGLMLAASVAFLVWIGPEKVIERVGTLWEGQGVPSLAQRVGAWERALDMIGDHLGLGTGLGTFRFAFMRYAPPGEGWWTTAHNEYLELVCDTGLAGAAIFLVGLAAYLFLVARPARFQGRSGRYAYAGVTSGLIALLFHSVVSSNLQVPANGMLIPILGAVLMRLVANHRAGGGREIGSAAGRPLADRSRAAGPATRGGVA